MVHEAQPRRFEYNVGGHYEFHIMYVYVSNQRMHMGYECQMERQTKPVFNNSGGGQPPHAIGPN